MKCEEIISILQQQSPETLACDWDNVGLLVGRRDKEINCVYVALDATDETIAEAALCRADAADPSSLDFPGIETNQ